MELVIKDLRDLVNALTLKQVRRGQSCFLQHSRSQRGHDTPETQGNKADAGRSRAQSRLQASPQTGGRRLEAQVSFIPGMRINSPAADFG